LKKDLFSRLIPHLRGDNTSRAVIVPWTIIGSEDEIPSSPPVIRALGT